MSLLKIFFPSILQKAVWCVCFYGNSHLLSGSSDGSIKVYIIYIYIYIYIYMQVQMLSSLRFLEKLQWGNCGGGGGDWIRVVASRECSETCNDRLFCINRAQPLCSIYTTDNCPGCPPITHLLFSDFTVFGSLVTHTHIIMYTDPLNCYSCSSV